MRIRKEEEEPPGSSSLDQTIPQRPGSTYLQEPQLPCRYHGNSNTWEPLDYGIRDNPRPSTQRSFQHMAGTSSTVASHHHRKLKEWAKGT